MSRDLIRAAHHDRQRSLGWLGLAWLEALVVHGPGDVQGEPVVHGDDMSGFIADAYALDGAGRRLYDSAFYSRPKGGDKSGLAGRGGLLEGLGPCRFAGWASGGEVYRDPWGLGFEYVYEPGEPMGRPVKVPFIRCMATEEGQTGNVYDTIYYNLTEGPLSEAMSRRDDAGLSRIILPGGGEITPSTASSAAKDGGKETFVAFDEALALDTPIPTPTGWTTIGNIEMGDLVLGSNGTPVAVVKTTEVMTDRDCYEVTFADDTSMITSEGHLWMTGRVGSAAKPRIRTTGEMATDGGRFKVPNALPWQALEQPFDIAPYVLGSWLGDGDARNAAITASQDDVAGLAARIERAGYTAKVCQTAAERAPLLYVSVPGSHRNRFSPVRGLKVRLADAGLLGNKHIPEEYLRGSDKQRLALLQGLMDTDGHASKRGACCFVNSSGAIVDGIMELLRSLGEDPVRSWTDDDRSRTGGYWRVTFTPRNCIPFQMPRKAARIRADQSTRDRWSTIKSIVKVARVPVRCIGVGSDDHLFLAGEAGKVTHNTHLYNTPELRRMYATVTRNLRKRKKTAGTWFLESTTMFAAGEQSVAEVTYQLAERIREGRAKRQRLLFDHRYGECDDLTDEAQLRAAIVEAYGDAIAWNDLDGLVDEFFEGRSATADSRRYFLNAKSSSVDAWLTEYEWAARGPDRGGDGAEPPAKGDVVTLGFDGSRHRARGVTDATALIGCRVSDGHVFQLHVWEQPSGEPDWQVPVVEVQAEVRAAFDRYQVAGFYADPAKWETYIAEWEAAYGGRLKVKATQQHPIQWWMTGGRVSLTVRALEKFEGAVIDGELTHDGASELTRHVLNARRRLSRSGLQIAKENPDSSRKIDAAVAAVLAWQARLDAVAAGVGKQEKFVAPRRLR